MAHPGASSLTYDTLSAQGNVFCVLDHRKAPQPLSPPLIQGWSALKKPRAFDQLLVVNAPDDDFIFPIDIYNADGSQAEQCGNGMRALAFWLSQQYPKLSATTMTLLPPAGQVRIVHVNPELTNVDAEPKRAWVEVTLPAPRILKTTTAWPPTQARSAVEVSMGNPHLVLVWPETPCAQTCETIGSALQATPAFSGGINVSFAHPTEQGVELRVFERGVGPTRACGSGACATAAALISIGLTSSPVVLEQPGGRLVVNCPLDAQTPGEVSLAGDVDWIGQGQWTL